MRHGKDASFESDGIEETVHPTKLLFRALITILYGLMVHGVLVKLTLNG